MGTWREAGSAACKTVTLYSSIGWLGRPCWHAAGTPLQRGRMAYKSHTILVIAALLGIGAAYGEHFQGLRLSDLMKSILCYDTASNIDSKNAYAYAFLYSNGISLCAAA